MKRSLVIALAAGAFAAGAATTYFLARDAASPPGAESAGAAAPKERKVLYWHDPMVPGPRFDKPGKSPFMDMDLVPVYADDDAAGGAAPVVSVRPEVVNSLGVRTYKVERARLARRVSAHGYLMTAAGDATFAQVDIFDRDVDWVRPGLPARVTLDALPGESLAGRVAQIDADLAIGARTLKVQVRLDRPDPRLKPGMFAEVTIESPATGAQLAIPREALLRTGTRTAVVVALGEGRFQPRDVVAGREYGEFVEIRAGLEEGESVVVSGQFLLDSEASLRASLTRMTPTETPTAPAPVPAPAPAGGADSSQHRH